MGPGDFWIFATVVAKCAHADSMALKQGECAHSYVTYYLYQCIICSMLNFL